MRVFAEPDRRDEHLETLMSDEYRAGLPMVFGAAVLLQRNEFAFRMADSLVESRSLFVEFLLAAEAQTLRSDPRFMDLAKKVGLYDYWERNSWPENFP
jgi:hypothetical protein